MAEIIHLEFRCTPHALVAHAQATIESRDGRFSGNTISGGFSMPGRTRVSGSYRILGHNLEIRIERRSMLVSRADVVQYLREEIVALELEGSLELAS